MLTSNKNISGKSMAIYKSTILELNDASALLLQTLSETSQKSVKAAIMATLYAHKVDNLPCIELNEIALRSNTSIATARKIFTMLKKTEGVEVSPANAKYETSQINVQMYQVPNFQSLKLPTAEEEKEQSPRGSHSTAKVQSRLDQEDIFIPPTYRGEKEKINAMIPLKRNDASLIACGNSLSKEKTFIDKSGYANKATSVMGIVNDFDISILDIMFQKSSRYYQALSDERYQNLTATTKIPIFMDDLLREKGMADLTENRLLISESIRRIWSTQYRTRNAYFSTSDFEQEDNFQYFASFTGLTANADTETESVNGELIRPYVAINFCWSPQPFEYITENPHLFVQSSTINSLPTLLYALYRKLRLAMLHGTLAALIRDTKTLFDLVQHLWDGESLSAHKKLCTTLIQDIKHQYKSRNGCVRFNAVEGNARAVCAYLDLGGFQLIIDIPNPDRPQNACNRQSTVFIDYSERAVIEHVGAKYDPIRTNNTPTAANPLTGKKRQLTALLKLNKRFKNLELQSVLSVYYFGYSYVDKDQKLEFLVTAYTSKIELNQMFQETADLLMCNVEQIGYFLTEKIGKLKPMPDIELSDIESLEQQGYERNSVLSYLCDNIRSTRRLKRENFAELKEILEAQAREM